MSNRSASKAHMAAIALTALLSVAACDAGSFGLAPSSDDAAVVETAVPTQTRWEWSGGDLQGWTINLPDAVVSWPETGGLSILAPSQPAAPDLFLRSPIFSAAGKDYTRVLVDLEAIVPAAEVDLALYYVTDSHGEGFDYRGGPLDGTPLAAGERRVLTYDMIHQAAGGSDWTDSTIRQLRFDLSQGAGSHFIVHSLQLCLADAADCG